MKRYISETLAIISFFIALFLLIHQQLTSEDVWFNWQQFWHHEPLIACFLVAAVALIVGKYLYKKFG